MNEKINETQKCYRNNSKGAKFKLMVSRVSWSGDDIEICSICKMITYDVHWSDYHKVVKEEE